MAARKLSKNRAVTNTTNKQVGTDSGTKHSHKEPWNSQSSTGVSKAPPVKADRNGSIRAEVMERILCRAPVGIVVCDARGKVGLVNGVAKKLALSYHDGEPITHVSDIWGEMVDPNGCLIPRDQSPCMKALRGQITNGQECCLIRPDSGSHDILFSAAPITSDHEILGMIATLVDITQHKDEELQLREDAVSKERDRMAADLHDTLCQSLSAIVLLLDAAEHEFSGASEKARPLFRHAHEVALGGLAEARRTLWTLSHESLENADLASALSLIARQLFAGSRVELELSLPHETRKLSSELRRESLRIAREALVNALKHANATKVELGLLYQKREVQLCVFDNGRGFAGNSEASAVQGSGLNNMLRRAERMGGKLVVKSLPGHGTRVLAVLPLTMSSIRQSSRQESCASRGAERAAEEKGMCLDAALSR
jgi:signal transduction histidine kinase